MDETKRRHHLVGFGAAMYSKKSRLNYIFEKKRKKNTTKLCLALFLGIHFLSFFEFQKVQKKTKNEDIYFLISEFQKKSKKK